VLVRQVVLRIVDAALAPIDEAGARDVAARFADRLVGPLTDTLAGIVVATALVVAVGGLWWALGRRASGVAATDLTRPG
jgi:hypothetical protein